MTFPPPNDYQPTNREIADRLGQLIQLVTTLQGRHDNTARDVATVLRDVETMKAVLFGDRSRGIERGMMERMSAVEGIAAKASDAISDTLPIVQELKAKESLRAERETRADARQKLLLGAASFLGVTNLAGILALIGYMTGVLT